jgi:hypothetical protein
MNSTLHALHLENKTVAGNGTNFIVDVAQTADEEGHTIFPSVYRFGGQMLPNTAMCFPN